MSELNQMYGSTSYNPMQFLVLKMSKSMSFIGVYSIVMGAISCLSIIGAAVGVPMIFAGIRLRESADAFKKYVDMNDNNLLSLALDKQERYFYIQKVLAIVGLAMIGLYFVFIIVMFAFVGANLFNSHSW